MTKQPHHPTENGSTSFHLPRPSWHFLTAFQAQTHPDIPLDDFSTDIVLSEVRQTTRRNDPRCPEGQAREISFVMQLYFTVNIKGKFTKNPEVECQHTLDITITTSAIKARIKEGSYREGDCK